jgi:tRNA(Arg) A34 adenosine deaminase TadA
MRSLTIVSAAIVVECANLSPSQQRERAMRNEQIGPGAASAMARALAEAEAAAAAGEVPVGAALVEPGGRIVAASGNRVERGHDPTAHAEMLVLRAGAARLGVKRLAGCDLYVTLEPCPMCAAAIGLARVRRVYFGAYDPKGGGVEHGPRIFDQPTCHHRPEIYGGIGEQAAAALLRDFFRDRR